MSQAGVLHITNNNPSILTEVVTNAGTAIPLANTLDIVGGTGITTSASGNTVTISVTGTGTISTLTGNTGGPISPTAGNINIVGSGSIAVTGSGSTLTISSSSGAGTVTSVSGTTNQVAVANGTTTPVISLIGPYTPATYTAHGVLIGEGAGSIVSTAVGATGTVLQGNTAADPTYSTATYPSTTTINQILYSSATNTISGLATANNGVLITSNAGVPSILAAGTTGQVLTATTGSPATWALPATSGTVTSVTGTANQVAVATGTTTPVISLIGPYTPATYAAHGVLVGEGTSSIAALSAGSAGQILQSGGASADPAYSTSTYPATNAVSTLLYASSANVMSALATANNGVLITSATGVPSILADGTTGQVLTATTGSPPSWAAAPVSGALVLISTQTASSSASLVFTTGITSTYNDYLLTFTNVIPATNAVDINVFCSINGGSSYLTTGYTGNRITAFNTSIGASNYTSSFISFTTIDNTAALGVNGNLYLFGLPSTNSKFCTASMTCVSSAILLNDVFVSYNSTVTAVNALQVAFSSGNIASGIISLYGIAK